MNDTVKEWVHKAEKDYATAKRELAVLEQPNYDAVCFHAQQCIEKLMKGLLIHRGIVPTKTHDLAYLRKLLSPACPEWTWPIDDLRFLTGPRWPFAIPVNQPTEKKLLYPLILLPSCENICYP